MVLFVRSEADMGNHALYYMTLHAHTPARSGDRKWIRGVKRIVGFATLFAVGWMFRGWLS